jgi:hypothetical protein
MFIFYLRRFSSFAPPLIAFVICIDRRLLFDCCNCVCGVCIDRDQRCCLIVVNGVDYFRWHERCVLFFKGASVSTTSLFGASFLYFCIILHRWEKVSSSWTTVCSIELAAQPLSTPHRCLRVTVLKLSDLTAFATSRFFCERSHSFRLVSCSFCERSHSFSLVSCTSPHSVVVQGWLSTRSLLLFFFGPIIFLH